MTERRWSGVKKGDAVLIAVIILIALTVIGIRILTRTEGSYVVVTVEGTETARYDLTEDRTVEIVGVDGGMNLLVIKDGIASVTDADCPDQLCVHESDIQYNGETIVCLPHQVVVSIEGGAEPEVDGIAQ